jgi:hypothetical protein
MPATPVIRISPPLTLDDVKGGPELCAVELIRFADPDALDRTALWPVNVLDLRLTWRTFQPAEIAAQIQQVVDHYADREFTGMLEIRSSDRTQPPVCRLVMRGRTVVRLDPYIGWPPEQADDSEDGLLEILADPDNVVSVTRQCAGYATDVAETVPADDTNLPERLLAWRDAAVQRALADAAGES